MIPIADSRPFGPTPPATWYNGSIHLPCVLAGMWGRDAVSLGHMVRHPVQPDPLTRGLSAGGPEYRSSNQGPVIALDAQGQAMLAAKRAVMALASGYHFDIVIFLSAGPKCVSELATAIGVSNSTVSQNLKDLRCLNLVQRTRVGRSCLYCLKPESAALIVDALRDLIDAMRSTETR